VSPEPRCRVRALRGKSSCGEAAAGDAQGVDEGDLAWVSFVVGGGVEQLELTLTPALETAAWRLDQSHANVRLSLVCTVAMVYPRHRGVVAEPHSGVKSLGHGSRFQRDQWPLLKSDTP
jgi:hypothetical protein